MPNHNINQTFQRIIIPHRIAVSQRYELSLIRMAMETSIHDVSFTLVWLCDTYVFVLTGDEFYCLSLLLVHFFE